MKRLFLGSAFAFVWIACSSTRIERGEYGPKRPQYAVGVDKQGRKEGPETWWYPNGARKYAAINREGFREGKYAAWYPDGKPWYEGFEHRGKPESTLTYWYPNGRIKSRALYRDGIQLERNDFDEEGRPLGKVPETEAADPASARTEEVPEAFGDNLRKASLRTWAMRVRQTVESYWVLPARFAKERPYRAVAKIKVARDGKIIGVSWSEKSPSAPFNAAAQQTFKRIKRLPAFPPSIKDASLDVQYEFISLGKPSPRGRLEPRDPDGEDPPGPADLPPSR